MTLSRDGVRAHERDPMMKKQMIGTVARQLLASCALLALSVVVYFRSTNYRHTGVAGRHDNDRRETTSAARPKIRRGDQRVRPRSCRPGGPHASCRRGARPTYCSL